MVTIDRRQKNTLCTHKKRPAQAGLFILKLGLVIDKLDSQNILFHQQMYC